MKRLAIIGSCDLGQLIAHHAINSGDFEFIGFFDDYQTSGDVVGLGKVLGKISEIEDLFHHNLFDVLLVGVGYNHMEFRKKIFEQLYNKIPFAKLVHKSCYVDETVILGEGVVLLPGCTLDRNVKIGSSVLLNINVVVAHDSYIGNYCFLAPSVNIAGFVRIDECCIIGINTTVIDNIEIGKFIRTGGGTVVINSILEKGTYVGIPAKKIVN
jgi:sugar O-acyltransferase (sialic acid O-acetyltransferase NeuD family)